MHRLRIPSPQAAFVDSKTGHITRAWWRLLHDLWEQTGLEIFETAVAQADLTDGAQKLLIRSGAGEQWKIRDILLSGDGTNFSGGSADRDIAITDGTSTWTVITSAALTSLAAVRWGNTGVPFPATASHLFAASASNTNIVAQYSGGITDYTAGEMNIMLLVEALA